MLMYYIKYIEVLLASLMFIITNIEEEHTLFKDMNINECDYCMSMYRQNQTLLDLITEAMKDEKHDTIKYKRMMGMTDKDKVRKQIEFAYNDEQKHYKMFQNIVYMLTGKKLDVPEPKVEEYKSLLPAVESSINGELGAVELYRKIFSMLSTRQMRDMLYEIITDEQEHATRFVYLYSMMK